MAQHEHAYSHKRGCSILPVLSYPWFGLVCHANLGWLFLLLQTNYELHQGLFLVYSSQPPVWEHVHSCQVVVWLSVMCKLSSMSSCIQCFSCLAWFQLLKLLQARNKQKYSVCKHLNTLHIKCQDSATQEVKIWKVHLGRIMQDTQTLCVQNQQMQ